MDAGVIYWTKTVTAHNTVKITIALCSMDAGLMDGTQIVITAHNTINITITLCSVDAGLVDWPKIVKAVHTTGKIITALCLDREEAGAWR